MHYADIILKTHTDIDPKKDSKHLEILRNAHIPSYVSQLHAVLQKYQKTLYSIGECCTYY